MKKFLIISNSHKKKAVKLSEKVKDYIISRGGECEASIQSKDNDCHIYTNVKDIPNSVEAIIAIGGDGTFIRAARDTLERDIPIIGINSGSLGFLTEIEEANIKDSIDFLFQDNYSIEYRMRLKSTLISDNSYNDLKHTALNDIVISREVNQSILRIRLYINDEHIIDYDADGLIVSTPTGSTGYSLSTGGPIVEPLAEMIIINPINPHSLISRSIVVSSNSKVCIEILNREGEESYANISSDGDVIARLEPYNRLKIEKSKEVTKVIRLKKDSFFKIIRNKMRYIG